MLRKYREASWGETTITTTMSPAQLPTRKIGNTDVTAIGYGAMNIAAAYGDVLSDEERFKVSSCAYNVHLMIDRNMNSSSMQSTSWVAPTGTPPTSTSTARIS